MQKFRKKPMVVEAVQWTGGNTEEVLVFCNREGQLCRFDDSSGHLIVSTLEGDLQAVPGDWIICGVNGEFYPCKPEIFEKTYESVE